MKNKYSKILVLLTVTVLVLSFVSAEASNKEDNKANLGNNNINEPLDKITFIHYKDGTVKEFGRNERANNKCYALLGVKWNSFPINYVIGSSDLSVINAISSATSTWDAATSKNLFGASLIDTSATWDSSSPDGKNSYVFGYYPDSNVIAVTIIWYTRYGMQIVDYDVLFNTQFTWGDATINPSLMDVQNIATHETGHGLGLADVYQSSCSVVTMFGYSTYGEIIKRTLEQPDINGLQRIYGA